MPDLTQIDAKMVQKRSTVPAELPTVAPSDDHTDGSWNDTDIYSAEFFINEADKKIYIRIDGSIIELAPTTGGGIRKDVFTVGGGGQSIFTLTVDVLQDYEVFEDGVIATRGHSKTGSNEITTTTTVPEGTVITIIY